VACRFGWSPIAGASTSHAARIIVNDNRYFISTTIPYVNAAPHLGHALEFIQTDAFARYRRARGESTFFLSGSDENSLKNVLAAEAAGRPTREFVEQNVQYFLELRDALRLSFDYFIRTSEDPLHLEGAARFWMAMDAAGDIYRKTYGGLYCVGCEQFYTESELVDGLCPEHETRPEYIEENNYFFRLSRYQDELERLISTDAIRIIPATRRNEALSFIRSGLEDISISRSQERARGWGIPVPGDPSQVMYVWIDALTNYVTALGYASDGELYREFWLENENRVHCLGKGVLRFHALYWPAMLLSVGVPPPTELFVHGYITDRGRKLSKSRGTSVSIPALVETYGADAVRYFMLSHVPPTLDADFSEEELLRRYNGDLGNALGNLLNRTVSMIVRYRAGSVPRPGDPSPPEIVEAAEQAYRDVIESMDAYDPRSALAAIWSFVRRLNAYVDESAPWTLARDPDAAAQRRLDTVLHTLAEGLRHLAECLSPFIPASADEIFNQLGAADVARRRLPGEWDGELAGQTVKPGGLLFPRLLEVESA